MLAQSLSRYILPAYREFYAKLEIRGVTVSPNDLHYKGRKVIVHGFPIGIEPDEFKQRLESAEVQEIISTLEKDFQGQKVIVGVDRLDYIKGIPQKLKVFDRFLTENPEWIGKVVLIQLAIPTRSDVDTYRNSLLFSTSCIGHILEPDPAHRCLSPVERR